MKRAAITLIALAAACSKQPAPASAPQAGAAQPAQASATQGLEPIPGVTTIEPTAPAAAPAPTAAAAPSAAAPTGDWGQVLSETVKDGILETTVQSPWGPIQVTGPADGPAGATTRYWQAWAKIDFSAIFVMTAGEMRDRLASMDTDAGRKDYRETIADRYKDNAPTWFKVEGASEQGDHATVLVRNGTKTGEEQTRECYLVKTADGWRFEKINARR